VFSLIATSDFSIKLAKKNKNKIDTRDRKIDTLSGNKISIYIAVSIKSLSPTQLCGLNARTYSNFC